MIKGKVLTPPGAEPYLLGGMAPVPGERTFRLAYRNNNPATPFVLRELEHLAENVHENVHTLRITLPNGGVYFIRSERVKPPAEEPGEVSIQLEQITIQREALQRLAKALLANGLKGLMVIRPAKRRNYFLLRKPQHMEAPIANIYPMAQLHSEEGVRDIAGSFASLCRYPGGK